MCELQTPSGPNAKICTYHQWTERSKIHPRSCIASTTIWCLFTFLSPFSGFENALVHLGHWRDVWDRRSRWSHKAVHALQILWCQLSSLGSLATPKFACHLSACTAAFGQSWLPLSSSSMLSWNRSGEGWKTKSLRSLHRFPNAVMWRTKDESRQILYLEYKNRIQYIFQIKTKELAEWRSPIGHRCNLCNQPVAWVCLSAKSLQDHLQALCKQANSRGESRMLLFQTQQNRPFRDPTCTGCQCHLHRLPMITISLTNVCKIGGIRHLWTFHQVDFQAPRRSIRSSSGGVMKQLNSWPGGWWFGPWQCPWLNWKILKEK